MSRQRDLGRTLKLHLINGSPTGVIKAELVGWTGVALTAPRTELPMLINRKEANGTCIYFLKGRDLEKPEYTRIYVGETDNIGQRLRDHVRNSDKEFCTHVCLITSKDDLLTKAHGLYLEERIIRMIRDIAPDRIILDNIKLPKKAEQDSNRLPESEIDDMERFLLETEVLLPPLGYDILRIPDVGDSAVKDTFILSAKKVKARAREASGHFIVLKGSLACMEETDSLSASARNRRQALIKDGALDKREGGQYEFTRDVRFNSPSGAADVICAVSTSGPAYWKHEVEGITYKEWDEKRLEETQKSLDDNDAKI